MANAAPLPTDQEFSTPPAGHGNPPFPHGNPAAGFQLPRGTKLNTPLLPFPPALQKKLDEARKAPGYCITVAIADPLPGESDRITVYMEKSNSFSNDWLMRMLATAFNIIAGYFFRLPLPQQEKPAPAPLESKGAQG